MLNEHKMGKYILITNGGLQLGFAKMWAVKRE